jgi:energy-coupling factor transporter ATP-binding protein EcfA2
LYPFKATAVDAQYFYGRETLTLQLVAKLAQANFLAIIGAAGSGKSSVLQAGLVHQLRSGEAIAGSEQWQIHVMHPGEHPLQQLALAWVDPNLSHGERAAACRTLSTTLAQRVTGLRDRVRTASAPRIVLIIDQVEEVFDLCHDSTERERFFGTLFCALDDVPDRFSLILAMRAEAMGRCLEQDYSGLADRIQAAMVLVKPLTATELEAAIRQPAERAGLTVEPMLVQQICRDRDRDNSPLPLIQYCLFELWRQQRQQTLQFSTYEICGRITHALDNRATSIYSRLSPRLQDTTKHIFLSLVHSGPSRQLTRRWVLQHRLVTAYQPEGATQEVIERFAKARLLIIEEVLQPQDYTKALAIAIAHDALLEHWSLLNRWLAEAQARLSS